MANNSPVVSALQNKLDNWTKIGAPEHVVHWITHGVKIPFKGQYTPSFDIDNRKLTTTQAVFVDHELNQLQASRIISRLDYKPKCVSGINVVDKKGSDKHRLIIDLRVLNETCEAPGFTSEDINTVIKLLQPGDQCILLDITKAFHHTPISSEDRDYFGFKWKNVFYKWNNLPFGWNCSQYVHHKILRPAITYLRQQGLRLVCYCDD
jgi:hypothetical protein